MAAEIEQVTTSLPTPGGEPSVEQKFRDAAAQANHVHTVHDVYLGDARDMADLDQHDSIHL